MATDGAPRGGLADLRRRRRGRRGRPLAGRRVLITGGSSGIGLACARRLLAEDARVVLLARGEPGLEQARTELGGAPLIVSADVADAPAMARAVADAAERLGGLDAVVAGAGAAVYGPFADADPGDLRRTIDTTLLGVLVTTRAALPYLAREHGTLVVIGSVAGRVPTPWLAAYSAAKHGVRGFVRALHAELRAQDIPVRVALVAPGPVDTPFWERSRTTDRRLPPRLAGVYRADDVAAEVVRALRKPKPERSVGGLMGIWARADAIAPSLSLGATARVASLGWSRRDRRRASPADGLQRPAGRYGEEGGLPSRPSLLVAARDRVQALRGP